MPNSSGDDTEGKKSVEYLSHFQCGSCQKWWSIGDAPLDRKVWYCPWCGKLQVVKDIEDNNNA